MVEVEVVVLQRHSAFATSISLAAPECVLSHPRDARFSPSSRTIL